MNACVLFRFLYLVLLSISLVLASYEIANTRIEGNLIHEINPVDNVEECQRLCSEWLGLDASPCMAYSFEKSSMNCTFFADITVVIEDATYISGRPYEQNFRMILTDESPVVELSDVLEITTAIDVRRCGLLCMRNILCQSFAWTSLTSQCQVLKFSHSALKSKVSAPGIEFYTVNYNTINKKSPRLGTTTVWSNWKEVEMNLKPALRRDRNILTPPLGFTNKEAHNKLIEHEHETIILLTGGHPGGVDYVYKLVPELGTVIQLAQTLPQGVKNSVGGYYNKEIVVDGGESDSGGHSTVFQTLTLDDLSPTFSEVNSITTQSVTRDSACGGVLDGKFYNCFGYYPSARTSCDIYDLTTPTKTHSTLDIINMPGVFGSACAMTSDPNPTIYAIGGHGSGGVSNFAYKIDLRNGSAVRIANYPESVRYAGGGWFQGDIIVCGGYPDFEPKLDACHRYNITSGIWTSFAPLRAVGKESLTLVTWKDTILAIGGQNVNPSPGGHSDVIDVYNESLELWQLMTNLPTGLKGLIAVQITEN